MVGTIFDIQRFCVHDGPGIRTTVFLKGCPLRCRWCHNPEGLKGEPQVQFFAMECIGCGTCGGNHTLEMVPNCPTGALKQAGYRITAEELLDEIRKDRDFYGLEGGVTVSGGECLLQADFVADVLRKCKDEGISTAVDTCGFVPWESIQKTLGLCDTYLYDIKCADSRLHKAFTGQENERILENFRKLSAASARIWIRIPVIPGFNDNDSEMQAMATIVNGMPGVEIVTLMPYHTLGKSKYETLGMEPMYHTDQTIRPAELEHFGRLFEKWEGLP